MSPFRRDNSLLDIHRESQVDGTGGGTQRTPKRFTFKISVTRSAISIVLAKRVIGLAIATWSTS